jgi:hypothetical protein
MEIHVEANNTTYGTVLLHIHGGDQQLVDGRGGEMSPKAISAVVPPPISSSGNLVQPLCLYLFLKDFFILQRSQSAIYSWSRQSQGKMNWRWRPYLTPPVKTHVGLACDPHVAALGVCQCVALHLRMKVGRVWACRDIPYPYIYSHWV